MEETEEIRRQRRRRQKQRLLDLKKIRRAEVELTRDQALQEGEEEMEEMEETQAALKVSA